MNKHTFTLLVALFFFSAAQAQKSKPTPKFDPTNTGSIQLNASAGQELKANPRSVDLDFSALKSTKLTLKTGVGRYGWKKVLAPGSDKVIKIVGSLEQKNWSSLEEQSVAYLDEIASIQESNDDFYFEITSKNNSQTGTHYRIIQNYQGIEILGSEAIIHAKNNRFYGFTGTITPAFEDLIIEPEMDIQQAFLSVKNHLKSEGIEWMDLATDQLWLLDHQTQMKANLKIKMGAKDQPILVWAFTVHPNIQERWNVLINARSGELVQLTPAFCQLIHEHKSEEKKCNHSAPAKIEKVKSEVSLMGPETAQAVDLLGVNRTINVYETGGTYYMIDASREMFNPSFSDFPDDAKGVIWTLDANNTYPQNTNFNYGHVTSSNNNWNNPNAVSAHFNGGEAYEYFRNTHGRNSINGQGGNIISLIRVSDPNGNDFDNAFWNGAAMFYGNGDQAFNAPLAKGLDVAGHEMSHGVIQATANLAYQLQSGALNESFADIFGVMIDRDDWFVGESVANPSVFPTGRMRDMSDPNNGGNSSDFYWQPKHMDDFRVLPNTVDGDHGGVHINSGIPNYAFFLFASAVGKSDAEKVYYEVLENHLTANSEFIDLRLAVVEVAQDLIGASGKTAAENAFDQVGILDGEGNDFQQDINENPGTEIVLWSDLDQIGLTYLQDNVTEVISNQDHITRPSISDDGSYMAYIDNQNRLIQIEIDWANQTLNESFFENNPQSVWRNVAVSKDGTKIALLTTSQDNNLIVFDRVSGEQKTFALMNPTTAQGVSTGDVQYADVMEWDLSGEAILYDAFNNLQNNTAQDISYWDIGLIKVWENGSSTFDEGQILKLFNGLAENESVGNPSFSKNSPYIIAFDYIQTDFFGENEYSILGANIETGDIGEIRENSKLGYPSFSPEDDEILFSANSTAGDDVLGRRSLAADKITGVGDPAILVNGPIWGHWFANGERDLVAVQNTLGGNMEIYPNPANDQLNITLVDFKNDNYQISLINLLGQQVISEGFMSSGSQMNWTFDLGNVPSGSYFLEIRNESGQNYTEKVIIE